MYAPVTGFLHFSVSANWFPVLQSVHPVNFSLLKPLLDLFLFNDVVPSINNQISTFLPAYIILSLNLVRDVDAAFVAFVILLHDHLSTRRRCYSPHIVNNKLSHQWFTGSVHDKKHFALASLAFAGLIEHAANTSFFINFAGQGKFAGELVHVVVTRIILTLIRAKL